MASTTLDQLASGGKAKVLRLNMDAARASRLMELGLLEGCEIEMVRTAPLGDPVEYRVGDFSLSVRKEDARMVEIEVKG